MEYSTHELGSRASLSDAIEAAEPPDPSTIVPHTFSREFLLTPVDDREARQHLCGQNREAGRWRLVSYRLMTH
jgi:hypothetical protein